MPYSWLLRASNLDLLILLFIFRLLPINFPRNLSSLSHQLAQQTPHRAGVCGAGARKARSRRARSASPAPATASCCLTIHARMLVYEILLSTYMAPSCIRITLAHQLPAHTLLTF